MLVKINPLYTGNTQTGTVENSEEISSGPSPVCIDINNLKGLKYILI